MKHIYILVYKLIYSMSVHQSVGIPAYFFRYISGFEGIGGLHQRCRSFLREPFNDVFGINRAEFADKTQRILRRNVFCSFHSGNNSLKGATSCGGICSMLQRRKSGFDE